MVIISPNLNSNPKIIILFDFKKKKSIVPFPHILPPNDISVNEDIPTEAEVKSSIKSQKDNKCKGINNTYAEHFKYATSPKLTSAILLLFTMIWSLIVVPKSWLSTAITCLHKKG